MVYESMAIKAGHLTLHRYFLNASRNRSLFLQKLKADELRIHTRKFILTFGMLAYSSSSKDGEEKGFVTKQSPLCYEMPRN